MFGFIKAINDQSGDWLIDVLGVPYGGPFDGKDHQGEYFSDATDLWLDRIPKRPIVYYHGGVELIPEVIGEELGYERRDDGVWFRVKLDKTKAYAARIWDAAKKGLARASSGAISHLVRAAEDGRLIVWPIGELSLLDGQEHRPVNPLARIELVTAKAIFEAASISIGAIEEGAIESANLEAGASDNDFALRTKAKLTLAF